MTELQRYLAEEIAEDHAEGVLTRREAVRRLGLMGLSASAASALLARFATEAPAAPVARRHPRGGSVTEWAPVATEAITLEGRNGTLLAAWAPAARPRGGVLVIHENRGLTAHIKNVAGRYAAGGYSALALDLLSEEGRHGRAARRRRPAGRTGRGAARALRHRHAGRRRRAAPAAAAPQDRRARLLLRRRHGLAPARLR
jgi:carboxymethylenebutenolidase